MGVDIPSQCPIFGHVASSPLDQLAGDVSHRLVAERLDRGVLPGTHRAGQKRGPSVHQPAPLVEQIASRVTPLDSPAHHVGKG